MTTTPGAVCTWIGGDQNNSKPSCTEPAMEGKSYCCNHVWRVYQEGSAVKSRKKGERKASSIQDLIDDFMIAADELAAEELL